MNAFEAAVTGLAETLHLITAMTWETWWALVLGFTISGAVEAFVDEERLTAALGGDGTREVVLGSFFGVASSSCSYSAVSTAKTLFKKGASATASFAAFMFAATDLVVELGLVMWVLLGWEFVVGEYLGGVVAVAVMTLLFRRAVPDTWVEAAREHVRRSDGLTCPTCDMRIDPGDSDVVRGMIDGVEATFCCDGCRRARRAATDDGVSLGERLLSREGWSVAARATLKEWEMVGGDIILGFVLAGLVGGFVPAEWWTALFGVETGPTAVIANAAVAVLVGVVTFMCSVGNIPFALVLWINGLPFGAVLSFVYADLLIPPLLRLYRRYYGLQFAAALTGALAVAALVAGVVVHYAMSGLGLVPPRVPSGHSMTGGYTTALNLAFTPVFLAQTYVAYGPEAFRTRWQSVRRSGNDHLVAVAGVVWIVVITVAAAGADLRRFGADLRAPAVRFREAALGAGAAFGATLAALRLVGVAVIRLGRRVGAHIHRSYRVGNIQWLFGWFGRKLWRAAHWMWEKLS